MISWLPHSGPLQLGLIFENDWVWLVIFIVDQIDHNSAYIPTRIRQLFHTANDCMHTPMIWVSAWLFKVEGDSARFIASLIWPFADLKEKRTIKLTGFCCSKLSSLAPNCFTPFTSTEQCEVISLTPECLMFLPSWQPGSLPNSPSVRTAWWKRKAAWWGGLGVT